uniref:Uncharacterized protein n=1 Tax=Glossina austeni TaxID=7395 RepID=A0A1A9VWB0_GLOAU
MSAIAAFQTEQIKVQTLRNHILVNLKTNPLENYTSNVVPTSVYLCNRVKQLAWWQRWDKTTLIILVASILVLLLAVIIICCIIICICRRRRRQDKYFFNVLLK